MNILKDIASGALPVSELPRFIVWAIGKTFWFWFVLILAIAVMLIR
jgi:Na+/H+ antiporter NhaD/arsenite permease-like protein